MLSPNAASETEWPKSNEEKQVNSGSRTSAECDAISKAGLDKEEVILVTSEEGSWQTLHAAFPWATGCW